MTLVFGTTGKPRFKNGLPSFDRTCCCGVAPCVDGRCIDVPSLVVRLPDFGDETTDPEEPINETHQACCDETGNDYPLTRIAECEWEYEATWCEGLTLRIYADVFDDDPPNELWRLRVTVQILSGATLLIEVIYLGPYMCVSTEAELDDSVLVMTTYTETPESAGLINCVDATNGVLNPTT